MAPNKTDGISGKEGQGMWGAWPHRGWTPTVVTYVTLGDVTRAAKGSWEEVYRLASASFRGWGGYDKDAYPSWDEWLRSRLVADGKAWVTCLAYAILWPIQNDLRRLVKRAEDQRQLDDMIERVVWCWPLRGRRAKAKTRPSVPVASMRRDIAYGLCRGETLGKALLDASASSRLGLTEDNAKTLTEKCPWVLDEGQRKLLRRMADAVTDPAIRHEVLWEYVQSHLRDGLYTLETVRGLVKKQKPLTAAHYEVIQDGLAGGTLALWWQCRKSDPRKRTLEIVVSPVTSSYHMITDESWIALDAVHMARGLMACAWFEIAHGLEAFFQEPKAIVVCRAPSCGRTFYTTRPEQLTCPAGEAKAWPSKCKMEWDRYARWLRNKLSRNPETDWADEKLKAQFIKQDSEWQSRKTGRETL